MKKLAILQPALRVGLFAVVSIASTPVFATGLFASFDSKATLRLDTGFLPAGIVATAVFSPFGAEGGDFVWAQDEHRKPLDRAFYNVNAANPETDFGPYTDHVFSVQMDATSGYLMSHHGGTYWFIFSNETAAEHALEVTLNFDWSIALSGAYADSEIGLDLFDQGEGDLGFARYDGAFSFIEALDDSVEVSMTNGRGSFKHVFNLAAGETVSFFADISVIGSLQPIPLPSTAWFFVSGVLILFGLGKQRRSPIQMPSVEKPAL